MKLLARRPLRRVLRSVQVLSGLWLITVIVGLALADPAAADNCGTFADCFGQTGSAGEAAFGLTLLAGLSLVLDFIPVVGDVKGVAEAITGRDLLTGEELEAWERALGLIPLLPAADVARVAGKAADAAEVVGDLSRHGDELAAATGAGRHGDELADAAGGARPPRDGGSGGGRPPDDGPGRGPGGDDLPPSRGDIENEMAAERARRNLSGAAGARGSDTLARVDVNGQSHHGVNSTANPDVNEWRRQMFDEVRTRSGQPQNPVAGQNRWPFHAEFEALARAWEASGRNLPAQVDIYVDKITCSNCLGGLEYARQAFGIEQLRIFQRGVDAPVTIPRLP